MFYSIELQPCNCSFGKHFGKIEKVFGRLQLFSAGIRTLVHKKNTDFIAVFSVGFC
ncbi:MAG: hypothetical protein V3S46_09905 [Nitrospinota bacterium]